MLENTENLRYFVLPAAPGELTDEQLERVAGGNRGYCWCCND